MTKREYLSRLLTQSPDWIRASMKEPTRYMTKMHIALHAIALRRKRICR